MEFEAKTAPHSLVWKFDPPTCGSPWSCPRFSACCVGLSQHRGWERGVSAAPAPALGQTFPCAVSGAEAESEAAALAGYAASNDTAASPPAPSGTGQCPPRPTPGRIAQPLLSPHRVPGSRRTPGCPPGPSRVRGVGVGVVGQAQAGKGRTQMTGVRSRGSRSLILGPHPHAPTGTCLKDAPSDSQTS